VNVHLCVIHFGVSEVPDSRMTLYGGVS